MPGIGINLSADLTFLPRPDCPTCHGEGVVERLATPAEVDAGCELGLAYDRCPMCQVPPAPPRRQGPAGVVDAKALVRPQFGPS
jgi:hypothetical protein